MLHSKTQQGFTRANSIDWYEPATTALSIMNVRVSTAFPHHLMSEKRSELLANLSLTNGETCPKSSEKPKTSRNLYLPLVTPESALLSLAHSTCEGTSALRRNMPKKVPECHARLIGALAEVHSPACDSPLSPFPC